MGGGGTPATSMHGEATVGTDQSDTPLPVAADTEERPAPATMGDLDVCIICNLPDETGLHAASNFLTAFSDANRSMRQAERLMLGVANSVGPEGRTRYLRVHKAMVRARRDWNRIDQMREALPVAFIEQDAVPSGYRDSQGRPISKQRHRLPNGEWSEWE